MRHLVILLSIIFSAASLQAQNKPVKKCKRWYEDQKYEKCIKKAENYLSKDPSNGELYYLKGFSHLRLYDKSKNNRELQNAMREINRGVSYYSQYKNAYAKELKKLKSACRKAGEKLYKEDRKRRSEKYFKYLAEVYQDTTEQYRDLFVYSERPDGEIIKLTKAGKINQTDDKGRKQGPWRKVYPNGVTAYEVSFKDDKPTGTMKRYHQNGKLMAEIRFDSEHNNYSSAKLYNDDEELIARGFYSGEEKDSLWKYYKNDFLVQSENYQNGQLHGKMKAYYPNGQVYDLRQMKKGKENGIWKKFYQNGNLMLRGKVVNDSLQGTFIRYYPDGSIEEKGRYKNDFKTGQWTYFTEDGKKHTITYKKGKPENADEKALKQTEKYKREIQNRLKDPENYKNNPYEYINE